MTARLTSIPPPRRPPVPSALLGALILVATEAMFFSGIMSASTIVRAGAPAWTWTAPGQPPLASPTGELTIAVVLVSGILLASAPLRLAPDGRRTRHTLLSVLALGVAFVVLQVHAASGLIRDGLTLTSSRQAGFYFLLVGLVTAHAVATLATMGIASKRLHRGTLTPEAFAGVRVLWYFVVVMWPIIYLRVCA